MPREDVITCRAVAVDAPGIAAIWEEIVAEKKFSAVARAWSPSEEVGSLQGLSSREHGYQKLVIWVRGSNEAAQRFYTGLGFRECGRLSRQLMVDGMADDEVLMEMFL